MNVGGETAGRDERELIVVADDSHDARALLSDVLDSAGYEVVTAASGEAALRIIEERRPALVILDLFMPQMNGFALRAELLRRPSLAAIPVVVLSGYWNKPSETLEAAAILPKPVNLEQLLEVVQRVVATHGAAEASA